MLPVFGLFVCAFLFEFLDDQYLSVPPRASDVKSWRDTKRVPVPVNAVSF